jgi:hypothetical protein
MIKKPKGGRKNHPRDGKFGRCRGNSFQLSGVDAPDFCTNHVQRAATFVSVFS